jgi:hypothetical protein
MYGWMDGWMDVNTVIRMYVCIVFIIFCVTQEVSRMPQSNEFGEEKCGKKEVGGYAHALML